MDQITQYKNWQCESDADRILWLSLDKEKSTVNTLNAAIFDELEQILTGIRQEQHQLKGVVFTSAKPDNFIAGADIDAFTQFKSIEDAKHFIRRGQILFDQIADLTIPTVAMINNAALGGGLELALACDYRVAVDSEKKILGLPEVMLGIHPGWGGSVRLPRLIGAPKAMDLILSGRSVTAKTAYKMGFVDAAVPERQLKRAARYYISHKPKMHQPSLLEKLTNTAVVRPALASYLRKQIAKKAKREHYPAPYAVLKNWQDNGVDHEKAILGEAHSLSKLALDDTAKNLVRVFYLQQRMKNLAKDMDFKAQWVHVVGAGVMGGDIALWCALRGIRVTLQDENQQAIAATLARAYQLFKKKLKKPRLIQAALDRLQPDPQGYGIARADVIIEAIFENLEVKQKLFKSLEAKAKPEAILATNTSSLPLDDINKVLTNPERLVGIHFFNPVAKMLLVEVVQGKITNQKVVNEAIAFVKQIGRLPVPVSSSPGFLVNRVLMPYLMECMCLLEEGVPAPLIDKAAKQFGMPMGPVELADTVGLDICLSVADNLTQHFGGTVPDKLRQMVAEGRLGRKTGEGFYRYKKGKPIKVTPKHAEMPEDLIDRLMLRMVNESMACLREGVVSDGDLLDGAMIFGTGFAPFRGGPIHYCHERGVDEVYQRLAELSQQYGERFRADKAFKEKEAA